MQKILLAVSLIALAACSPNSQTAQDTQASSDPVIETSKAGYDIDRQYAKFAEVPMDVDTSFLSESEKQVVNKLIEASGYLSEIYLRQRGTNYARLRSEIEKEGTPIPVSYTHLTLPTILLV